MKWYVIQTKPMAEDKVCKQFELPKIETFYPKIRSASALGGRVIKWKSLFPSYIFLRLDLEKAENHHMVKYTRGVNKVLGDGERPVPISDNVIETIRARTNESGVIEQTMFKVGGEVKVRRGYFKDLIGILDRPVSDNGRVAVLLRIFNREMRTYLKCSDIVRA